MIRNLMGLVKLLLIMYSRKGQGMSIRVIILAVIGLIIAVVVITFLNARNTVFGAKVDAIIGGTTPAP